MAPGREAEYDREHAISQVRLGSRFSLFETRIEGYRMGAPAPRVRLRSDPILADKNNMVVWPAARRPNDMPTLKSRPMKSAQGIQWFALHADPDSRLTQSLMVWVGSSLAV